MSISDLILGSIVALTFSALAYFSKRLVDENDRQHKSTIESINSLSLEMQYIKNKVVSLEVTQNKGQSRLRLIEGFKDYEPLEDIESIKTKVTSALTGINQVKKEVDKILPEVEKNKEMYGDIIWVKEEMSAQNKKICVMYEVLERIVKSR